MRDCVARERVTSKLRTLVSSVALCVCDREAREVAAVERGRIGGQGQHRRAGELNRPVAQCALLAAGAVAPQRDGDGLRLVVGDHRHAPAVAVEALLPPLGPAVLVDALRLGHVPVRHAEGMIAHILVRNRHGLGQGEVEPVEQVPPDEGFGRGERRREVRQDAALHVHPDGIRAGPVSAKPVRVFDRPSFGARLGIVAKNA